MSHFRISASLALCLLLSSPRGLGAPPMDAAPPLNPPGSAIAPEGTTLVQMWSEHVLLDASRGVSVPVAVTATFRMRNTSAVQESMQVRFPLQFVYVDETTEAGGEIDDFTVSVDSIPVPTGRVLEPISLEEGTLPIPWATFPAVFPPASDVVIEAKYSTYPSAALSGSSQRLAYMISTGAAWHGPIELVEIDVNLPYRANRYNAIVNLSSSDTHLWDSPRWSGPTLAWTEWHVEPTPNDNFNLWIVDPERWDAVIRAQEALETPPRTPEDFIRLSQAYYEVGAAGKSGACGRRDICSLSLQAAQEAHRLFPGSASAIAQAAWMRFVLSSEDPWRAIYSPESPEQELALKALRCELVRALQIEPSNPTANDIAKNVGDPRDQLKCD